MSYCRTTGKIYFVTVGNDKSANIAVFRPDGTRLPDIASPTTHKVKNCGTDSNGNIYMVSGTWCELYKTDENGNNAVKIAMTTYDGQDITAEYGNLIAVLETSDGIDGWVEVFDQNGNRMYGPWKINGMNTPTSIALEPNGSIIVIADGNNNRLLRYSVEGDLLTCYNNPGSGDGQLSYPNGIEIGTDGKIYIADGCNYRVQVFDQNYNFLTKFGNQGHGNGQFWGLQGITIDNEQNIFTTDTTENGKLQKLKHN